MQQEIQLKPISKDILCVCTSSAPMPKDQDSLVLQNLNFAI